ncbi:S-layer homology domain-containing protein [Paenibacillus qinlingensis]|nr:S-layer homology domain-containing protein [Paenibacillus qinlingensis]
MAETSSSPFSDISGSFAKDAINQLQKEGILTGMDAEHFNPKGTLTRAQFIVIMVKSLNLPIDNKAVSSFTDVEGWAVPYIEAAKKYGIIDGISDSMFAPNATLTREQSAVVMVKALQKQGEIENSAELTIPDAASVSDWAKKYVALAFKYKLVTGNEDGSFNPQGTATREQAAQMGSNFIESVEQVKEDNKPEATAPIPTVTPAPVPKETPALTPPPASTGGGGGDGYLPPSDTAAPVAPTNFASSDITQTGVTLSWTRSTDNVGITGYDVYQDDVKVATVTGTESGATIGYTVDGLTANTSYVYTVKAIDAAGNVSSASAPLTVTTLANVVITPTPTPAVTEDTFSLIQNGMSREQVAAIFGTDGETDTTGNLFPILGTNYTQIYKSADGVSTAGLYYVDGRVVLNYGFFPVTPSHLGTLANYDQVKVGMTKAEVESLLVIPNDWKSPYGEETTWVKNNATIVNKYCDATDFSGTWFAYVNESLTQNEGVVRHSIHVQYMNDVVAFVYNGYIGNIEWSATTPVPIDPVTGQIVLDRTTVAAGEIPPEMNEIDYINLKNNEQSLTVFYFGLQNWAVTQDLGFHIAAGGFPWYLNSPGGVTVTGADDTTINLVADYLRNHYHFTVIRIDNVSNEEFPGQYVIAFSNPALTAVSIDI